MKSLLECPVCLTIPRNLRIFLCCNGHRICSVCFDLLHPPAVCPQGKCAFAQQGENQSPMRNRDLEKIIEELSKESELELSCLNWREGCSVEQRRMELEKHEQECPYRRIPCPLNCGESLVYRKLHDHLKEQHRTTHFKGKGKSLTINWSLKGSHFSGNSKIFVNGVWESLDGERFYCHLEHINGKWISWITVEGGTCSAENWRSIIKIQSKDQENTIMLEGDVFAIDEVKDDIIASSDSFTLTDDQVRNLRDSSDEEESTEFWGKLLIEFSVGKK